MKWLQINASNTNINIVTKLEVDERVEEFVGKTVEEEEDSNDDDNDDNHDDNNDDTTSISHSSPINFVKTKRK